MEKLISFKQFNEARSGNSVEGFVSDLAHMAIRGAIGAYRRRKMAKAKAAQPKTAAQPQTQPRVSKGTPTHDDKPTRMSADEYRKEVGLKPRVSASPKEQRRDQRDADSKAKLHKHFADKYGDYKAKYAEYKQKAADRKARISKAQDDAVHARVAKDREKSRQYLASKKNA